MVFISVLVTYLLALRVIIVDVECAEIVLISC